MVSTHLEHFKIDFFPQALHHICLVCKVDLGVGSLCTSFSCIFISSCDKIANLDSIESFDCVRELIAVLAQCTSWTLEVDDMMTSWLSFWSMWQSGGVPGMTRIVSSAVTSLNLLWRRSWQIRSANTSIEFFMMMPIAKMELVCFPAICYPNAKKHHYYIEVPILCYPVLFQL